MPPAGIVNKKIKYYLIGVFLGCLLLAVMPKPFQRSRTLETGKQPPLPGAYPIDFRDGYGRIVTILRVPHRIISLAPSITEILFALEANDRMVGNTRYCEYPVAARDITKIGDLRHPDIELMLYLRPALVIGTVLTSSNTYRQMEEAGLAAVALEHSNLQTVLGDIRTVGKLINRTGEALRLVHTLEARHREILTRVKTGAASAPPRTVFLYDLKALSSAGSGSWVGDMITECGAENVAASAPSAWPRLSLESLVARDPEIILVAAKASPEERREVEKEITRVEQHPVWKHLSAIRNHRVHILNAELFTIPGPRMVDALEAIAAAIHPTLFSAPDAQ